MPASADDLARGREPSAPRATRAWWRRDATLASLVGLLAFAIYLRTLYPGLVGDGDTPKFQYVGAILGTPHNPGYPLYLLLSHAFSRLPLGSLAYRINLMSAVAAALAPALLFVLQRRLGCSRAPAAAAALAAGFGPVFWSQATLAEVYALAGALTIAVVLCAVTWGATRREGALLCAIALFALSLGHHLTIVMLVPALLFYALRLDARAALRPRLIATGALLIALGLSQYLLILVRTLQGAPYLGSAARDLGELVDVVRGAQFANRLFAFDARTLVTERLPLFARLFGNELGIAGSALAWVGLFAGLRQRPREAVLLALSAAGVVVFALNYKVDDTDVFLIPAFVLAWPFVGLGLEAAASLVARERGRGVAASAALACLALPAWQLATHFKASDHSGRTFEGRYFRAMFEALPPNAVVLAESYTVDQMILYEMLGEGWGERKQVRLATSDPQSVAVYAGRGLPVFAFGRSREALGLEGFRFEPVRLGDEAGAPFPRRAFPLFRLHGLPDCAAIGNAGWQDVTSQAAGGRLFAKLDDHEPFDARFTAWLIGDALAPRLVKRQGRGAPVVDVRGYDTHDAASRRALDEAWHKDGMTAPVPASSASRLDVGVNDEGAFAAFTFDLGGAPATVLARARVDLDNPRRALVCRPSATD